MGQRMHAARHGYGSAAGSPPGLAPGCTRPLRHLVGQARIATLIAWLLVGGLISPAGGAAQTASSADSMPSADMLGADMLSADMARIRARMLEPLMTPDDADRVQATLSSLRDDGSFANVDYADQNSGNWATVKHLSYLQRLARALVIRDSPWHEDPALSAQVLRALDYWLENDFINSNWWWNKIGAPRALAQTLLLIEDRLSAQQREAGARIVARARIGMTGANLVDVAFITLMRALFQHDPELLTRAASSISDEIKVTTGEGIQPDWSFHQHGALLYNHGYGAVFMDNCSELAAIVTGTQFALSEDKIALLNGLILDGTAWMTRYDTKDYGATGRGISRGAGSRGSAAYLREIVTRMLRVRTGREADYRALERHLDGGDPPFSGNRCFYRSDFMTHQRGGWYASARMFSNRLRNTDSPHNNEGLRSHHLGDGCTYIMRSGREYHDIFPVWNWWKIPGTTVELTPELDGSVSRMGTRPFAGGASDGTYGVAGFHFERERLEARKAWFFFDDELVCLGAAIASGSEFQVITTVNQCFLHGEVTHGDLAHGDAGSTAVLARGTHLLRGRDWLHHDGITYVFPDPTEVEVTADTASGNWWRINHQGSRETVTRDVFTVTIDHGRRPGADSYVYIVAPGIDRAHAGEYAAGLPVRVLTNTYAAQAVMHTGLQVVGAVFYRPGSIDLPGGVSLSVDRPCALVVHLDAHAWRATVSSPLHESGKVTVVLSGSRQGEISVELPEDEWAGGSVSGRSVDDASTAILDTRQYAAHTGISVQQNYPNPFTRGTVIRYVLPQEENVRLAIYNIAGQRVVTLEHGARGAGVHAVHWDGRDQAGRPLANGVYLYRLQVGRLAMAGKLVAGG